MLDSDKKQNGIFTTNVMDTILNSTPEDLKASLEELNTKQLQKLETKLKKRRYYDCIIYEKYC